MVVRAIDMLAVPGLGPPSPRPIAGQRDSRVHKMARSQSRVPTLSFTQTTTVIPAQTDITTTKTDVKTKQHGGRQFLRGLCKYMPLAMFATLDQQLT